MTTVDRFEWFLNALSWRLTNDPDLATHVTTMRTRIRDRITAS